MRLMIHSFYSLPPFHDVQAWITFFNIWKLHLDFWVSPFSFILAAPSVKQHCKEERIRVLPQWCGRPVKSRKLLFQIIVIKGGCMSYWIMGCTLLNQRLIPVLMVHTLYSCKKTTCVHVLRNSMNTKLIISLLKMNL